MLAWDEKRVIAFEEIARSVAKFESSPDALWEYCREIGAYKLPALEPGAPGHFECRFAPLSLYEAIFSCASADMYRFWRSKGLFPIGYCVRYAGYGVDEDPLRFFASRDVSWRTEHRDALLNLLAAIKEDGAQVERTSSCHSARVIALEGEIEDVALCKLLFDIGFAPVMKYEKTWLDLLTEGKIDTFLLLLEKGVGVFSKVTFPKGVLPLVLPTTCGIGALRKIHDAGWDFGLVNCECEEDVLLLAIEYGAHPFLPDRSCCKEDDLYGRYPYEFDLDYRKKTACDYLIAHGSLATIEALVNAGMTECIDPFAALIEQRNDVHDLLEASGVKCGRLDDYLIRAMDINAGSCGSFHEFRHDPVSWVALFDSGYPADWDLIAKRAVDFFVESHCPNCNWDWLSFRRAADRVRWMELFEPLFERVSVGFSHEITIPMKERELKGRSRVEGGWSHLSSSYWLQSDEQVYPFLYSNGVDIRTDATPEAVMVHCLPAVSDLVFSLNGWNKDDLKLTRGQISQCIVASESSHALTWAYENFPKLVSLENIKVDKIKTDEFKKTVSRLKRREKKDPSAAKSSALRKPTIPQLVKQAIADLKKGDYDAFNDLSKSGSKVKPKPAGDLLSAIAKYGDASAVNVLCQNFALQAHPKSGGDPTDMETAFWIAVASGNKETAFALLDHGIRVRNSALFPFFTERLSDLAPKGWSVLASVIEENPDAIDDVQALAIFAIDNNRPKLAESAIRLALERSGYQPIREDGAKHAKSPRYGCFAKPLYLQLAPGRREERFDALWEALRPGVSSACARVVCKYFPSEIDLVWTRRFLDFDIATVAVMVGYMSGEKAESKGRILSELAAAGRLKEVKKVSAWNGVATKTNLAKAIDAASSAGESKTAEWLKSHRDGLLGNSTK